MESPRGPGRYKERKSGIIIKTTGKKSNFIAEQPNSSTVAAPSSLYTDIEIDLGAFRKPGPHEKIDPNDINILKKGPDKGLITVSCLKYGPKPINSHKGPRK